MSTSLANLVDHSLNSCFCISITPSTANNMSPTTPVPQLTFQLSCNASTELRFKNITLLDKRRPTNFSINSHHQNNVLASPSFFTKHSELSLSSAGSACNRLVVSYVIVFLNSVYSVTTKLTLLRVANWLAIIRRLVRRRHNKCL